MVKKSADISVASESGEGKTYNELLKFVNPIAKPLAGKKLTKKLFKCVKKASKEQSLCRGVKDVQKNLLKGQKGLVVFAGDTQPIEVMCHLPILCEDSNVHYCYVPSKHSLGEAIGSTKPTCCVLIKKKKAFEETYSECLSGVQEIST